MRSFLRLSLGIVLLLSLLPGCALLSKFLRKKSAGQEMTKRVQLVGTISLVNPESNFVLVDSGSLPSPAMGASAQARAADGSLSELRVTEVRKRPFVIADIVNGTPHVGDRVFQTIGGSLEKTTPAPTAGR